MIKNNYKNLRNNAVSQNVKQTDVNKTTNEFSDPSCSIYWFRIYTSLDSLKICINNHVEDIDSYFVNCEREDLLELKEIVLEEILRATDGCFDDLRSEVKSKHDNLRNNELSEMIFENN